jgi:hypothetical protein
MRHQISYYRPILTDYVNYLQSLVAALVPWHMCADRHHYQGLTELLIQTRPGTAAARAGMQLITSKTCAAAVLEPCRS